MVKVTGGGRGLKAIVAHFRYISKNARLDIEDERGEKLLGKEMHEIRSDIKPFSLAGRPGCLWWITLTAMFGKYGRGFRRASDCKPRCCCQIALAWLYAPGDAAALHELDA